MSATSQYYDYLDEIGRMKGPLQQVFCGVGGNSSHYCHNRVNSFVTSNYLDVDYDTISRSVVLTAQWAQAKDPNGWELAGEDAKGWTEKIRLPSTDATVEIGVLSLEGNADPEDVQFGGFLTVLGQDERPSMCIPLTISIPPYYDCAILTTRRTHTFPNPNPTLPPPSGL